MKNYNVNVEFEVIEFNVKAKNKRDARKKAVAKLRRMSPVRLIKKSWPDNESQLLIDEL